MDLSAVRIKEHFGLITNDTNTRQFRFIVSPPKNRGILGQQDYVIVDHPVLGEACPILAEIKEITSYEEITGSSSIDRMGRMLATSEVLGYLDLRKSSRPLRKLLVPPIPGSRVYVPLPGFLEDSFNRNVNGEVFANSVVFGKVECSLSDNVQAGNQIKCYLDVDELSTKHTLIAAMTGIGKTHLVKALIQEMSTKINKPIVILDHAGEYINFKTPKAPVVMLAAKPERVAKKTDDKQTRIRGLGDKNEKETLIGEVKPGQIAVLNGQGLAIEERRVFYANCLKILWKNRTDEKVEPFFLVVEEAENLKGETLDQIITEGRKNGVAICLVSMHPVELGGRVLSQISNQIIGKTTSKDDAEMLADMINVDRGSLSHLAVGEWIVSGVNRPRPMKVQMRD